MVVTLHFPRGPCQAEVMALFIPGKIFPTTCSLDEGFNVTGPCSGSSNCGLITCLSKQQQVSEASFSLYTYTCMLHFYTVPIIFRFFLVAFSGIVAAGIIYSILHNHQTLGCHLSWKQIQGGWFSFSS